MQKVLHNNEEIPEVGELANHSQTQCNNCLLQAWCGVQGMVDEVRNKGCEPPVVSTIPEQVCHRHGLMPKPGQENSEVARKGRVRDGQRQARLKAWSSAVMISVNQKKCDTT